VPYGRLTDDDDVVAGALEEINNKPVDVVQFEHGLAGESGGRRVSATLAPVRDSNGRALYLFLQVQDVSAERAAAEQLRRSEERFRLLVETVEDYAIFMLDPGGHVVSWNSGAQRSKGYTANEIIGQHFRVFYPPRSRPGSTRSTSSRRRFVSATTRRRAGASARTGPGSGPPC
jgi:PAS domain-containing protein